MSLEDGYQSVRHGAGLSRMDHVGLARVSGDDAIEAVDAICSGDLWVRDGRMIQSLILDERGQPVADVYVCPDDDDCILMVEGLTTDELSECLRKYADAELTFALEDLRPAYELLSLNGPYAWEALSQWLTPDIIGLPYLSFYHFDRGTCFRAGKTGEYGYDLAIRSDEVERAWEELLGIVRALGGGETSLETLDLCALENGFFSVRNVSVEGLTPLELQLQWRVSARKRFPGESAIKGRRADGMDRRLTHFVARESVETGEEIRGGDDLVGEVVAAAFSPSIGGSAGMALLDLSVAYPGIDAFFVPGPDTDRPVRTVSSPLLFNRSLLVDPHRHTYATRDETYAPPLWLGSLP